ncbi:cysteine desulfurase family protein [Tateyamaria armeniaca]|uniref:Cysteine desulfurase n=1 Tax=Tateyamaria armeniaca TaxID=2518930 RepID=A0ABW8UVE9_9RHOB
MSRVYLDHNATTPLRPEAREAMLAAMDVVGNPSSVHAEGRAAKMLVERARAQVAELVECKPTQVVFTGSATEAAALAVAQKDRHGGRFAALPTEHDCFLDWSEADLPSLFDPQGALNAAGATEFCNWIVRGVGDAHSTERAPVALVAMSAANSETGVMLPDARVASNTNINALRAGTVPYSVVCDITQMAGKVPVAYDGDKRPAYMILSAHKLGGPKGVGALINFTADDPAPMLRGGGQEMGRRSGTENVIGVAGFGAAAEAAHRDVMSGKWAEIEKLRNILESALEASSNTTIFVGKDAPRLPNTTCFATPGWKGETQVMQMDLAGFAISAGSACSSGKVKASRVLTAMGLGDVAANAVRVSLGLETTEDDVTRFAEAWAQKLKKHEARAA